MVGSRKLLAEPALERLAEIARRVGAAEPDVLAVYLYGSAARREPAADIDVAVLLERNADLTTLERLAAALQQEGAPAGPELDVRALRGTGPRFRTNVLREGRLLFERRTDARIEFEAVSMSEWLDFKPTWERMRAQMLERWAHG